MSNALDRRSRPVGDHKARGCRLMAVSTATNASHTLLVTPRAKQGEEPVLRPACPRTARSASQSTREGMGRTTDRAGLGALGGRALGPHQRLLRGWANLTDGLPGG